MPELVTVGRVLAVHGVRGWVKIYSHTEPKEQIFHYRPWYLLTQAGPEPRDLAEGRPQGKGLVALLEGVKDRNAAMEMLVGREIAVPKSVLPASGGDTWYWRDLIGLRVVNKQGQDLGVIAEMLETGANDVMRVLGDAASVDERERLLPWAPDDVVLEVKPVEGKLHVDWDADF